MNWTRWATAVTWIAVGVSAAAWGLPWWPSTATPAGTTLAPMDDGFRNGSWAAFSPASTGPAADAAPAAAADASRFQLLGIAGPSSPASGTGVIAVALLSVDGQPPRAYRVGEVVADGFHIEAIGGQTVRIAPVSGASVVLQAPPLPPAATGLLAAASALPGPGTAARPALTPAPVAPSPIPSVQPGTAAATPAPSLGEYPAGGRTSSRAAEVRERLRGSGPPRTAAD